MRRARRTIGAAALTAVLAACTGTTPDEAAAPTPVVPGQPVVTDGCLAPEQQRLQEAGHLLGTTSPPVPYSSVPPTSGWHAGGAPIAPGAYGTPVSEPEQVHWLEQGGVVVTYDPDALAEEQVAALLRLPAELPTIVVTPYETPMASAIAIAAWGWLQRCGTVEPATVAAFVDAYGGVDLEA